MLSIFVPGQKGLVALDPAPDAVPDNTVWLDLLKPVPSEEAVAEAFLGVDVPSHEERVEIETSSRLYEDGDALVMSATVLCGASRGRPRTTVATFILARNRLASVRFDEPTAFTMARQQCLKRGPYTLDGKGMLLLLLDAIIDRIADVLEHAGAEADRLSHDIFEHEDPGQAEHDYDALIRALGRHGTLLSKIHESLVSLSRLLEFLGAREKKVALNGAERAQMKSLTRDIRSLNDFAGSLDTKITFLLDATVGLVSLQQNRTIKIFSVLAVILMPPTLIASIYGMNFKFIPETSWTYGYPLALTAMVAAAVGTWVWFRWKRWL